MSCFGVSQANNEAPLLSILYSKAVLSADHVARSNIDLVQDKC